MARGVDRKTRDYREGTRIYKEQLNHLGYQSGSSRSVEHWGILPSPLDLAPVSNERPTTSFVDGPTPDDPLFSLFSTLLFLSISSAASPLGPEKKRQKTAIHWDWGEELIYKERRRQQEGPNPLFFVWCNEASSVTPKHKTERERENPTILQWKQPGQTDNGDLTNSRQNIEVAAFSGFTGR